MMKRSHNNEIIQHGHRAIRRGCIFLGIMMLFSLLILSGGNTHASLCIVPTEEGSWENNNTLTRGITRLEFRLWCEDTPQTVCNGGICTTINSVTPHYYIHLFGSCYPTDCDWGEVEGEKLNGSLDGWYYFSYNQSFAMRFVYVRTYPQWPGWLRLWIYTDFTDPNRSDYVMDDWFRK